MWMFKDTIPCKFGGLRISHLVNVEVEGYNLVNVKVMDTTSCKFGGLDTTCCKYGGLRLLTLKM